MHKEKVSRGHKIVVGLALFAIVLFVVLFSKGLTLDSKKITSPLVGQTARPFHVRMLQGAELLKEGGGDSIDLADLKGVPLILNFWASWCSSCAEEAQIFESFWKEHRSDGVKMLGIAVHDKAEDIMPFVKALGKTYPIGLDEEGRVALNYGVTGVPETVFIDAQGIVVHKEMGPVSGPLLEKILAQLKASAT